MIMMKYSLIFLIIFLINYIIKNLRNLKINKKII